MYLAGIKYGGKEQWEFMLNKYLSSPFPSEQRKIMFALADSSDESTLKKLVALFVYGFQNFIIPNLQ